jgi:hypothetical protein
MEFNVFGWTFKKAKKQIEQEKSQSFVLPQNEDGAVTVEGVAGAYGAYIDFDATVKNEFELVTRYREMALLPEVDFAIDDIINEMIVMDGEEEAIKLNLSNLKYPQTVKKKIEEEFTNVLSLLDWSNQSYEISRKWYIDGRLFFHILIDEKKPEQGIKELRYIDPRQIRKVREVERVKDPTTDAIIARVIDQYYNYNVRGISYNNTMSYSQMGMVGGIKIKEDCVCYAHSGIVDQYSASVLSHLHKAIKPINQLKMMEDAMVIYRIARAPERRIFYVDVGNLPKSKADDYLRSVMQRYRNKLQYNIETGEIKDERRFMSMLEDYWLPRREGSQGTSIDTLPGGENLGEMADVEYFQKKVYRALNVPVSRLDSQTSFQLGRAAEITRDEVKFAKFINRLRVRFGHLFKELLQKQLILKKVISMDEWDQVKEHIKFDFNTDNHFAELKNSEIVKSRLEILGGLDAYANKYYSVQWIRENILKQTSDEMAQIDKQIEEEKLKYADPLLDPIMAGAGSEDMEPSSEKSNNPKSKKSSKPKNEDADGDEDVDPKYN